MNMNKNLIVLLFSFVLFVSLAWSQKTENKSDAVVVALFTKDSIMIGDQLMLRVTVNRDIMQETQFPQLENSLGGKIEILSESPVDTLEKQGRRITLKKDYVVTSFDAGNYNFGRFPILFETKNKIDTIFAQDSLRLYVNTFIIDSTKHKIVDITPQLDTPLHFDEIKHYVFGGLAALILIAIAVYYIRKYIQKRKDRIVPIPLLPPHIEAITELEKIYSLKLWKEGKHKVYFTHLTDILRSYLMRRFEVNAMEMTSDEILVAIKDLRLTSHDENILREVLVLSDLVKFAKFAPLDEECEKSYAQAYGFVQDTKPNTAEDTKIDKPIKNEQNENK